MASGGRQPGDVSATVSDKVVTSLRDVNATVFSTGVVGQRVWPGFMVESQNESGTKPKLNCVPVLVFSLLVWFPITHVCGALTSPG